MTTHLVQYRLCIIRTQLLHLAPIRKSYRRYYFLDLGEEKKDYFTILNTIRHHHPHANLVDGGGAGKERLAKEHLGEDAAETPHVHAHCVPLRGK